MTKPLTEMGTFVCAVKEGIVPCRYFDIAGVATVFIGHTAAAGNPHPNTIPLEMPKSRSELDTAIERAFDVFEQDLKAYAGVVDQKFKNLSSHERDGWTSWHFNTGGAYTSSAVGKWNAGDKRGAIAVLKQWNKVTINGKKVVSSALVKRRQVEADMILEGEYPKGLEVPVWPTNNQGSVMWKAIDMLDFEEVRRIALDAPPEHFLARLWALITKKLAA